MTKEAKKVLDQVVAIEAEAANHADGYADMMIADLLERLPAEVREEVKALL